MARTTKCTLRRGRERRKADVKARKKMAGLQKRLDSSRKAAENKYASSSE